MPKITDPELPLDVMSEPPPPNGNGSGKQTLDIRALKEMNIAELTQVAKDLGVRVLPACASRS